VPAGIGVDLGAVPLRANDGETSES
jgi:hypothetical protein